LLEISTCSAAEAHTLPSSAFIPSQPATFIPTALFGFLNFALHGRHSVCCLLRSPVGYLPRLPQYQNGYGSHHSSPPMLRCLLSSWTYLDIQLVVLVTLPVHPGCPRCGLHCLLDYAVVGYVGPLVVTFTPPVVFERGLSVAFHHWCSLGAYICVCVAHSHIGLSHHSELQLGFTIIF
jgi:hypothetical protein